jgi:hypothetical protein
MNREFQITPAKTYATIQRARSAVEKSGDQTVRHTYLLTEDLRWFPVFFPTEDELSTTGVHFRWNVIR